MSRDTLKRPAQSQSQDRASANERRISPGKVTLTSKLSAGPTPSRPAPVQRKQSAAGARPTQAGGDMVEDWMMVALRPDLHQEPTLRPRSEIGYAHAGPRATLQAKRASAAGAEVAPEEDGAMAASPSAGSPLPAELAASMEAMSGVDLSGVRVHRGSSQPASVGALAYSQGNDIHLGPGAEAHLPHEAWHVVQQAQGRVRPTMEAGGVAINDDPSLEREADELGARAARGESTGQAPAPGAAPALQRMAAGNVVQRVKIHKYRDTWKKWEESAEDEDCSNSIPPVDTAAIVDPLELFDLAMEIKEYNLELANEIWPDYERAFRAWFVPDARVMRLDSKLQPVGRATAKSLDGRGCFIRWAKQKDPDVDERKHHNVKNIVDLRSLRPLRPGEQDNDVEAYKQGDDKLLPNGDGTVALAPNTEAIVQILGVSAKVGKNIQARHPPADEVRDLIAMLDTLAWSEKKTEARTVYIQEGPWDAAEEAFAKCLGVSGKPSGTAEEANRRWQIEYHGVTAILREESSVPQDIAATIELQLGEHICEYKWARVASERRQERGRVEHWDPQAPIEQFRASLVEQLFVGGQSTKSGTTSDLVGGSTGATQQDQFGSWDDLLGSGLAKAFKPEALEHLQKLSCPEQDKLRFVNRGFTGSRITVGNDSGLHEMEHGLARINEVRSYITGKIESQDIVDKTPYQEQLRELDRLQQSFGASKPAGGAKPDTQLLSIEGLFWERFGALSAEAQIHMINDSIPALKQASTLAYEDKHETGEAEPESVIEVSGYEFHIGSRHAYKFHEQSIDSHPGFAGTQKEIELAIMKQALQRHLAGALPRVGAVGKMSESTHAVEVNGVRIVYLAWSPAPTSRRVFIPDYMARPEDAPTGTSTGPSHSAESELIGNLEMLLNSQRLVEAAGLLIKSLSSVIAPELLLGPVGQLVLACVPDPSLCQHVLEKAVMPLFGHVPRPLVHGMAEAVHKELEPSARLVAACHAAAPAYAPDLIAELAVYIAAPDHLTALVQALADIYGGPDRLPEIAIHTLGSRARALMNQEALDRFFTETKLPTVP
jgi:hypothetical protein